jgi:16S rRNA (cytosine1402-N4)-methyltransferase
MLAPADQISLWLHGVGHEVLGRPRAAATPPGRKPPSGKKPPTGKKRHEQSPRAGRDSAGPAVTGDARGQGAPTNGPQRHIPVLLREVVANLAPHDGGVYVDGTFGAGGYSAAILAASDTRVVAIDRDPSAVPAGQRLVEAAAGRLTLVCGEFAALDRIAGDLGIAAVDGVVLDIGVSSMQLDTAERGFSFRLDGPLDMRMAAAGPSAADVIAQSSERELADIIFFLGEERRARAVARAIVAARGEGPITTTRALADIVARVVHGRPGDIHPATRTFQAFRLYVNDELGQLAAGLAAAERVLAPGGRLVVVSFHSLEDRIVKNFLSARSGTEHGSRHLPETTALPATFERLTRRPIEADDAEVAANPRARSAKLRAAVRTAAPAHEMSDMPAGIPSLHRRGG